ncbi:MAG: helix-turn-helix domain-containing protein [Segniliparus sp.]|uniref:helix-turn-helix domain-containing protein n=1 Tax=Segniliparus sp. TaxID=2804064 RepID=UPI003F3915F5
MAARKPPHNSEGTEHKLVATPGLVGGESRFLTVAEVAGLMRVSKMTVYRLVHSGELPAVRVGRSFRVHSKAVHDYLETSYYSAG